MPPVDSAGGGRIALSVAAPAFNEAAVIADVVREWCDYLDAHPAVGDWEVVVCDDGSTDGTGAALAALRRTRPGLVVVTHPVNRGAGAAIATAVGHTTLEWVALLDSDGQFPIGNLDAFVRAALDGGGMAFTGVRTHKVDDAAHRWGSTASTAVSNLLHRTRFRDFNSVFKVVHGPLFRALELETLGMSASTEITARVLEHGHAWVEIPVEHRARTGGRRTWRFLGAARDRALVVGYLGLRSLLLRRGVLRAPEVR